MHSPAVRSRAKYYGVAVKLRRSGQRIDDEILAHISPAHSANINFFSALPATDRCGCATPPVLTSSQRSGRLGSTSCNTR